MDDWFRESHQKWKRNLKATYSLENWQWLCMSEIGLEALQLLGGCGWNYGRTTLFIMSSWPVRSNGGPVREFLLYVCCPPPEQVGKPWYNGSLRSSGDQVEGTGPLKNMLIFQTISPQILEHLCGLER